MTEGTVYISVPTADSLRAIAVPENISKRDEFAEFAAKKFSAMRRMAERGETCIKITTPVGFRSAFMDMLAQAGYDVRPERGTNVIWVYWTFA